MSADACLYISILSVRRTLFRRGLGNLFPSGFLGRSPKLPEAQGYVSMVKPIIRIDHLTKTFSAKKKDFHALKDVQLDIYPGEVFGIIGKSGAGKSTLVRCINFLERPSGGTVFFEDVDLFSLSPKELNKARRSMGMIFQQFNLLMQRNALKNICFPLEVSGVKKDEAVKRARELLALVGLSEKEKSYPSELSGGQKQRVAIARALATNPKVLLCDEATSALDPETTKSILGLLKDINKNLGITIVVITHEMAVVEEICHRIGIIDEGSIAEVGLVTDIFTKPQSEAGRRLVYPSRKSIDSFKSKRYCRIVFDGRSSFEPVIANMVLDFGQPVNIMYADTKDIDGNALGQIVIQLPEDEEVANKMMAYLWAKDISAKEVEDFV